MAGSWSLKRKIMQKYWSPAKSETIFVISRENWSIIEDISWKNVWTIYIFERLECGPWYSRVLRELDLTGLVFFSTNSGPVTTLLSLIHYMATYFMKLFLNSTTHYFEDIVSLKMAPAATGAARWSVAAETSSHVRAPSVGSLSGNVRILMGQ